MFSRILSAVSVYLKMSKHALIGGGTGFIGRHLAQHLNQNGYDVTIISRMPGLRHITWHELAKSGVPNGVTSVINVAGQNVLDPTRHWTDGFKQNVWNSRINSSASLAKAIESAPQVKSFVNISGVSHYPPRDEKLYNETDEVEGFDYMSELCIAWEKAATPSSDATKRCRVIKLRTGVVVGNGGGMIQSITLPFKLGFGGPMGTGKQIMPWIHLHDLLRLIQHCMEESKCEGALNAVAPEVVTNGQFSQAFATALNRPCAFAVPEFVVKMLFGEDRSALLLSGARIEPKRTIESGFEFKYPTAKAACEQIVGKV